MIVCVILLESEKHRVSGRKLGQLVNILNISHISIVRNPDTQAKPQLHFLTYKDISLQLLTAVQELLGEDVVLFGSHPLIQKPT